MLTVNNRNDQLRAARNEFTKCGILNDPALEERKIRVIRAFL